MKLIHGEKDKCVYSSLSMLLRHFNISALPGQLKERFEKKWDTMFPFNEPYQDRPRVPSIDEIVNTLLDIFDIALVPFTNNPQCSPSATGKPSIPVHKNPESLWEARLNSGAGLLEGMVGSAGHMCACDRGVIYDPRGYVYSANVCDKFNYVPLRFWLALDIR